MRIDPKKLELHLARKCMSETDLRNGTSPQTLLRIRRGMEVNLKTKDQRIKGKSCKIFVAVADVADCR